MMMMMLTTVDERWLLHLDIHRLFNWRTHTSDRRTKNVFFFFPNIVECSWLWQGHDNWVYCFPFLFASFVSLLLIFVFFFLSLFIYFSVSVCECVFIRRPLWLFPLSRSILIALLAVLLGRNFLFILRFAASVSSCAVCFCHLLFGVKRRQWLHFDLFFVFFWF